MSKDAYNSGISARLINSIKKAIGGADEKAEAGSRLFSDVDKIAFVGWWPPFLLTIVWAGVETG